MRKLTSAILLLILAVWLAGCDDNGGFTESVNLTIETYTHQQIPSDYVAANVSGNLPSDRAAYTLHVQVRAKHTDGSTVADGTVVNMSFDGLQYGSLSKLDDGDDDNFNHFTNCEYDDGEIVRCTRMGAVYSEVTAGTASFFFTSTDATCPTEAPCVTLRATIEGSNSVAEKPIRVGEPGSGSPVDLVIFDDGPAFVKGMNMRTVQRVHFAIYDEKYGPVADAAKGINNVRARIVSGPSGVRLIGTNASGETVTGNDLHIRTGKGMGEVTLQSGSTPGLVLIDISADREDNNVDNGFGETIHDVIAVRINDTIPPPPTPDLAIITDSLPDGVVGDTYGAIIEASGGTAPYLWSSVYNELPTGLTLVTSPTDAGILYGTPSDAGTHDIIVRVTDARGKTADQVLRLLVE